MDVGYARTSTETQLAGLEAQERLLRQAGCERVFSEQVSKRSRRRMGERSATHHFLKYQQFSGLRFAHPSCTMSDLGRWRDHLIGL